MAFWPFGRKSKKRKADSEKMAPAKSKTTQGLLRDPRSEPLDPVPVNTNQKPTRGDNQRRQRSSSRRLTKRVRDAEGTEPPLPVQPMADRTNAMNEKILPGATARSVQNLSKVPTDRGDVPSYYFQNPMSSSSLQPEKFSAIPQLPTLSTKRSANDSALPRRKSSKRKADDLAREQEIKAMSSPIPIPRHQSSRASGLLARDSRKIPGGLNRNLERPPSDVSLPMPESLHSSVSAVSDQYAFKISAIDALSPRPTIKLSSNPQFVNASGSLRPSRTSTRKEKQPVILEETLNPRNRVNELANEMDAGSIRELMERDRRRTEQNRRSDQEKLQRKLQRRAEKQRAQEQGDYDEASLGDHGIPTKPEIEELETDRNQQQGIRTPESWLKDPSKEQLASQDPFHDPAAGPGTSHLEEATPIDEPEEVVLETAKAIRLSQASMSPPTSPTQHAHDSQNLSQLTYLASSSSTPDIPEQAMADREEGDPWVRRPSNWRSIFRRSGTRAHRSSADRGRATPSEFSNTSRESVSRQMPPSAFTRIPRARSGTPVRTQSRFKEDLPELPISPPDSRVQSPADQPMDQPLSDIHPAFRHEVALSRHQSLNRGSPEASSSAVLSQSLASVDSEGSWLTGRPVKRSSQSHVNPLRESANSLQQRLRELGASEEDLGAVESERDYRDRHSGPEGSSTRETTVKHRDPLDYSADTGGGGDDRPLHPAPTSISPEEGTWHSAVAKQPTIVRQGARAKSREGLLNDFQAAEDSTTESSPVSPSGDSPIGPANQPESSIIQRATSVNLGKSHARHISAGSAKLLNLPARSSSETKRMSSASGERSPLGPPSPGERSETRASDVD
ncbi:MAG: hypothetical protein LQ351_007212 [Letrouitia transgressa]|nr:MAG: hypothetical protein LQ351_007212 [Letrouitia transgressa]